MTLRKVNETDGIVTITFEYGIRIHDSQGKLITQLDGNSAFYVRLAREALALAHERETSL